MFNPNFFRTYALTASLFIIAACGSSSDGPVSSPGSLGPVADITADVGAGSGGGGTGSYTGACSTALKGDGSGETALIPSTLENNTICYMHGVYGADIEFTQTDVLYGLQGQVDVGVDCGGQATAKAGCKAATLTLPAGIQIVSDSGDDFLVVNRGSKLIANGGANTPIVFTAAEAFKGNARLDTDQQWGGIVILGKSYTSKCNDGEGMDSSVVCDRTVEGADNRYYGGYDLEDNSGILRYVRVEYAGKTVSTDVELNGITFAGVGRGTLVDYVQVHNNSDDCVEFFGGTVNVTHIICTGASDDSLDMDEGYNGNMQYIYVKQTDKDGVTRGDHVVEFDGVSGPGSNVGVDVSSIDGDTKTGLPRTQPKIANFTFISSGRDQIVEAKEGVAGYFMNGVMMYRKDSDYECLDVPDGEQEFMADWGIDQDGNPVDRLSFHNVHANCYSTVFASASKAPSGITGADIETSAKLYSTGLVEADVSSVVSDAFNGSLENGLNATTVMTGSGDILDDDDADVGDKPLKAMCVAVSANVDLAGQQAHGPCRFNAINEDNEAADWGLDPWFDGTNYVGAFVPGSTKTSNWALEEADGGWTLTGSIFDSASCPEGTLEETPINGVKVCSVSGVIASPGITLTAGVHYVLDGRVDVGVDRSLDANSSASESVLTIEPGVTVFGKSGDDYLVVNRGNKINAIGTASAPIVMTSESDLLGMTQIASSDAQWGGVVILGNAISNNCTYIGGARPTDDSCADNEVEGVTPTAYFGGEDPTDNSGTLKYVRVQYAGYTIGLDNELNGITFGGVGSGTTVEYVQVHNNSDDGVEMFGGSVDVKYLVITGASDDSIDLDEGYNGRMQHVIVSQVTRNDGAGDKLVESDNKDKDSTETYTWGTEPRTNPKIANFTFVSNNKNNGIHLKEGVSGQYYNGLVVAQNYCIQGDGKGDEQIVNDSSVTPAVSFNSVGFDCGTTNTDIVDNALAEMESDAANVTTAQLIAHITGASPTYGFYTAKTLDNGTYSPTLNHVIPGTAELGLTAVDVATVLSDDWFDEANYVGALKSANAEDQWYRGWTLEGSLDAVTSAQ